MSKSKWKKLVEGKIGKSIAERRKQSGRERNTYRNVILVS